MDPSSRSAASAARHTHHAAPKVIGKRPARRQLGEERSSWITTVRSVGYRFG